LRRKCLLKRIIEGKIEGGLEVVGRRERRRKKRGYWKSKEKAPDRAVWRTAFARGY
jgi:hypothetical protein